MFLVRSAPEDLDPARLAALRLSLNAPVVSVPELPAGPARAAIALWWEAEGRPVLEVRLRSVATGQRVVYGFEDRLEGAQDVERALEAGLNFAESMGFLFDEDAISADDTADRIRVREAWAAFSTTGQIAEEVPADASAGAVDEAEAEAALLELTELADPAPDAEPAPQAAGAGARAATPPAALGEAAAETPMLTKFRHRPEAEPAPSAPSAPVAPAGSESTGGRMRAALGRVPLVRRRRRRGRERPSLLARVLGAF